MLFAWFRALEQYVLLFQLTLRYIHVEQGHSDIDIEYDWPWEIWFALAALETEQTS
jgi:hypothetical protein